MIALGQRDVEFELGFVMMPHPDGSFAPALVLVMFQPSPIMGMTNHATALINSPGGTTREGLKEAITNLTKMLADTRSSQLGMPAPPNANGPIIPGNTYQ